jgi:glycosyltransferase involved in cell wall biosynthesis
MIIKNLEGIKKQVVFLSWSLWGGGQEKFLFYLAKHLNPAYFEPHVVYSNQPENRPVEPDPSISIHFLNLSSTAASLANTAGQQNRPVFQNILRHVFRRLPTSVKDKLKSYRNRIFSKFFNLLNPVPQSISADQEPLHSSEIILKSIFVSLTYAFALRKVLAQLRVDAVIVAMQEGPTIQAWLNKIHDTHNYISYLCIPESIYLAFLYREPEQLLVEKWLFENACRAAKTVIVPNEWMRADIEREFGIDHKSIRIIPNAIDCQQVLAMSEIPISGHINLSGKTVFVQLARLDPQKNHELTIESCDILRKKLDNFLILVIGDGTEKAKIKKMVYKRNLSNYIHFFGDMKNPYPYLKIARASILTSRFEASPLVLLDSLLLGAVPVCVDCIAGPRDILCDGKYGILVPPNDPNAFAEAMYRIATDDQLHYELKSLGMPRAFEFDISIFVKQWEEVLCSGNGSETHP